MRRIVPGLTLAVAAVWLLVFASAGLAQQDAGQAIFQRECAGCHQPDGSGVPGAFPPLAGNPNAADPSYVADVVRNGRQGPIEVAGQTYDAVMPPVAGLTDAEIDTVASYVASLAEGGAPTTPTQRHRARSMAIRDSERSSSSGARRSRRAVRRVWPAMPPAPWDGSDSVPT